MHHGVMPGNLCQHDDRGTVDLIVPEEIPVRQHRLYTDHPSCLAAIRFDQLAAGTAQHIAGLKDSGELLLQLIRPPHIIGIQKRHILAPGKQHAPVAALRRPEILLVMQINHTRIRFILTHDAVRIICRIVINNQNLQFLNASSSDPVRRFKMHILCEHTVNGSLQRGSTVVQRNNDRDQKPRKLCGCDVLCPDPLWKRGGFFIGDRCSGSR